MRHAAAIAVALAAGSAAAQPACGPLAMVEIVEGVPRDRILIENLSLDGWEILDLEIALAGSAGRLVFDTVPGGPGLNVAQGFRGLARPGADAPRLTVTPDIADGDERMALSFEAFSPGERFTVTIDLDDRLGPRGGTQFGGGEVAGAGLTVRFGHVDGGEERHSATFGADGKARAAAPCVS